MKRTGIFFRVLAPTLFALLLLPLVSYGTFRVTAERRATRRAENQLTALQVRISGLTEQYFSQQAAEVSVLPFIRRAAQSVQNIRSEARMLLYASEGRLIYPYEEDEREQVGLLAEAAAAKLPGPGAEAPKDVLRLDVEGESYLLRVSGVPSRSEKLEYVVTYCPVSSIEAWIDDTGRLLLWISWGMAAAIAAVIGLVIRGITRSLDRLCAAADRIRERDFSPVEPPFTVREIEELRVSMDRMADQLSRADAAQKTFFQNVSHELRTPLMSIGGYAQGIEQGRLPDPRVAARVILSEARRLTGMVNDLLTLSRLDRAAEPPELHRVDLTEIVNEALERVSGSALKKGVRLEGDIPRGLGAVSDEGLLAAILDNLLSNAVRHAHTRVCVAAQPEGGSVTVSVRDDGDGIAPEDMPHLFERCYKGRNGHFGVGLAIADSAAKQSRAQLRAYNSPEGGAVFTATLESA